MLPQADSMNEVIPPDRHYSIAISIGLALIGYWVTLCMLAGGPRSAKASRWLRGLWTVSCLAFLIHVVSAYHFEYRWDHQEAVTRTAEQTKNLLGVAFGEGLYFNYVFMFVWIADVVFWWSGTDRYPARPMWLTLIVHGYLFFIAFNGAVVFKSGVTRVVGLLGSAVLAVLLGKRIVTRP